MTTPYDRIARRFIEVDKELDKLPVRREAARRRRKAEQKGGAGPEKNDSRPEPPAPLSKP